MSIEFAILGFLSWRTLSGYEIKKMFENSNFLYWSGNNNQIYKALVQLHKNELVTWEIQNQDKGPSKKNYSITQKGMAELKKWVLSSPEPPQLKNSFLIQLAWADQLSSSELDEIVGNYEEEIQVQLLMSHEQKKRNRLNPSRSKRETYVWNMISENQIRFYETELAWVQILRDDLSKY